MLKFEFSVETVREIGKLLERAPYNKAAPLLAEIQRQITAQQQVQTPEANKEAGTTG